MLGGSGVNEREKNALIQKAKFGPMSAHCKVGHPMKWLNVNPYNSEGIMCDSCNLALNDRDYFHHCFTCESDFCKTCGPMAFVNTN